MMSVRTKSGTVKGFKLLEGSPYFHQMQFLQWIGAKSQLVANKKIYKAVTNYKVENLDPVVDETIPGYDILDETTGEVLESIPEEVYYYNPKPTGEYWLN